VRFQLYPTGLESGIQSSWRSISAVGTAEGRENEGSGVVWPDADCFTWASMDRIVYQLLGQDHFVFTLGQGNGENRRAAELKLVGYGATLKRQPSADCRDGLMEFGEEQNLRQDGQEQHVFDAYSGIEL
jgi:hypothetical protein